MNESELVSQPEFTESESAAEEQKNKELFPIVAIGASAGGLTAFTELMRHLPTDTNMGFVLIQHLKPDYKSLLTEILGRITQIPVIQVRDGMSVQPNRVYVIPPNTKMTITEGLLRLTSREKIRGMYMPIDAFFYSLAKDRKSQAIAVVLSGADGDGSRGLKAIKAAGGITFAECEETAQVTSMPNTAVATGDVDFILSPSAIAQELGKISHHPYITRPTPAQTLDNLSQSEDVLENIFALLRSATKIDFTDYKQTTLKRQIMRRMALYRLERLEDYIIYLQGNPTEVQALFQDFLIHVTSFFRDAEVFEALKNHVFPNIIQNKAPGEPIRIWVAGCSTGEEVYSIAICLLEFLDSVEIPTIQIFGTDISEEAIEKARLATYMPSSVSHISQQRLQRFFVKLENGYQVCKHVRQMCIFAKQNLIADPPFSRLDLISCRNVLIYFKPILQKKIIRLFNYSLKPTGFLLLGTSESMSECLDLFTLVNKQRIYSPKLTCTALNSDFNSNYLEKKINNQKIINEDAGEFLNLYKEADRIIWSKYAPAGVIINNDLEILQFRGDTSPYLTPAPGKASFKLLNMVQANLLLDLRAAITEAKRLKIAVRKEGIFINQEQLNQLNLEVIPFKAFSQEEGYFLVLFEKVSPAIASPNDNVKIARRRKLTSQEQEIIQLKQELAASKNELSATKDYLQSIICDQEAINQELTVANEEILSSNEELQSTNEELETAKEEIQATNEEVSLINEELNSGIIELNKVNSDLQNLLGSVNIPIIMLGKDLSIRRFTPIAGKIFNLIKTDVGRSLNHIKPNINVSNLEQLLFKVINTLETIQQEVQDKQGYWYDLWIRPYKDAENKIDGAVIVLVDIDARKRSAEQLKESRDYAEAIVETIREPLIVLDANLRVQKANRCFYEFFQVSPTQIEHNSIFELGNGQWNIPQLRSLLKEVLTQNKDIDSFEVEHIFENIGRKIMLLNACQFVQKNNKMILIAINDITERKLFEEQGNQLLICEHSARTAAEAANRAKDEFLSIVSHELRAPLNSILGWTQLLLSRRLKAAQTAHALEVVEASAKLQVKLVEDLLDISCITTNKLQLNLSAIALAPVIEAAINTDRPAAEVKNIELKAVLSPHLTVLGDPNRLQQVISNLLSNAIKFTPIGGRVTVKLKRINSVAQIQVSDTGQGISADFLPYVFERFRQADSSSTRTHGGLGLGLTIVYNLVELHGGTVQAESRGEGQGTTITVRLPLEVANSFVERDFEHVEYTEAIASLDTKKTLLGLRVLAVDDEAGMLELLKTILEDCGAEVTAVDNAALAIALLTENPQGYDILLSDIGMPNKDGYALIEQVRALGVESGGNIPAIALTAFVRVEEQKESLAAGFQRHITKPIEISQLISVIAEVAKA